MLLLKILLFSFYFPNQRDYREGWPLLTVELRRTGTQRGQMKGVLSWLVRWACRAGTRDFCSAWAALVGLPFSKYFSLTAHYFNSFVPTAQQAGQAVVLSRLSLSMRLCSHHQMSVWSQLAFSAAFIFTLLYKMTFFLKKGRRIIMASFLAIL